MVYLGVDLEYTEFHPEELNRNKNSKEKKDKSCNYAFSEPITKNN